MLTCADACGGPRTGVGTPRDVDYDREKGSEFDFNYEFNVSSRITGIYMSHILLYMYVCIYIYIYIKFTFSMFRAASQVLSLLALLVFDWY